MDSKNSIGAKGPGKRVADAGGTRAILEDTGCTVAAGSAVAA
ncbi:ABC transporter, partial [Achromobacter ruhlandii]|nr:ABC transporter [Achromobacter ruhlandii]